MIIILLSLLFFVTFSHSWAPDPINIDKTAYCKVCKRFANELDDRVGELYRFTEPPTRPKVNDLKALVRSSCKRAEFRKNGLEACRHIVRRSVNTIVHTLLSLYFESDEDVKLRRNPAIKAGDEKLLATKLCTSLAFTTCPPTHVDQFITPDHQLWHVPADDEELTALAERRAARAAAEAAKWRAHDNSNADDNGDDTNGDDSDDDDTLAALQEAAHMKREAANVHYASAVDAAVQFDDDDAVAANAAANTVAKPRSFARLRDEL